MKPIRVTRKSVISRLATKIGKKRARRLVYAPTCWIYSSYERRLLADKLEGSRNLKDIRLLHLFRCHLSAAQQVILDNNGGFYLFRGH